MKPLFTKKEKVWLVQLLKETKECAEQCLDKGDEEIEFSAKIYEKVKNL